MFKISLIFISALLHCNENPIYIFPEKELRGLSPNFHMHVSVSDVCVPRIGPHTVFPAAEIGWPILGIYKSNRSQTHECGNWDWDQAIPFLEIFVSNFRIVSVQCVPSLVRRLCDWPVCDLAGWGWPPWQSWSRRPASGRRCAAWPPTPARSPRAAGQGRRRARSS